MKTFLAALALSSLPLCAQTITPSVSVPNLVAGKSATLALTFTPGSTGAAATQWSITPPAGVTIAGWTIGAAGTAAGKTLTCSASNLLCVLVGMNTTPIGEGVIATATITTQTSARGAAAAIALSADATGAGLKTADSSIAVFSPFDLNFDGKVDSTDLLLAIQQVLGGAPCTNADFNSDGACNVQDLVYFDLDAISTTP